jgi:hypothetical protein
MPGEQERLAGHEFVIGEVKSAPDLYSQNGLNAKSRCRNGWL